ncbi:high molecular weight rubredoxin [Clostridia bacterium]|nr:high molecular weight rubredoxin [Clostridia bacterium]
MNTTAFFDMSYGVYIVTSLDHGRPVGCVANSIMQITSDPATIALSLNHDNYTHSCVAETGQFAFSILSENTSPEGIRTFGFQSSRTTNKFAAVPHVTRSGLPIIKDSLGYAVCKVISTLETATHTIFLGQVIDADRFEATAPPMTYAYYHSVLKGKTNKKAPTYQVPEPDAVSDEQVAPAKKTKWVCDLCGYVYEGDALPDDYTCPICGYDKFS